MVIYLTLTQSLAHSFVEGQAINLIHFMRHTYLSPPPNSVIARSNHRQCINEWTWLHPNKLFYHKTQSRQTVHWKTQHNKIISYISLWFLFVFSSLNKHNLKSFWFLYQRIFISFIGF